jgi:hypothetical protein
LFHSATSERFCGREHPAIRRTRGSGSSSSSLERTSSIGRHATRELSHHPPTRDVGRLTAGPETYHNMWWSGVGTFDPGASGLPQLAGGSFSCRTPALGCWVGEHESVAPAETVTGPAQAHPREQRSSPFDRGESRHHQEGRRIG